MLREEALGILTTHMHKRGSEIMDMLILFSALFAYQSMVIILYIQQKRVSLSSNSNKDDIIFKCIQDIYQNSLLNHKKFFEKNLYYTKHSQGSLE